MDYEKAYKEALERAKSMMALPDDKATMKYIFPELAESEDERIRKWLLGICKNMAHACRLDLAIDTEDAELKKELANYEASILYLEKQKVNTDGDFARGYDCGYECCLNSHGAEWFEKQKEQKSAEWSEEDEKKLEDVLYWFEIFCHKNQSKPEMQESLNWLKSLRPQPHWKPSEEQMDELEKVSSGNTCAFNYEILRKLYDDLKKL